MIFYKNLYVGEGLEKKKNKIIRNLKRKKYPLTSYVLTLVNDDVNQLEFCQAALFYQKALDDENLMVVGIAAGYLEAIELVKQITEQVYKETGGADLKRYILEQQNG